jgi:putative ABC transport system permease protein
MADSWALLARGEAAWVSEQWQRVHQVALGERIELPGEQPWSLLIAGVYADYGNPRPQMLVSTQALLDWYPGDPRRGFAVRTDPADAAALVARAQEQLSAQTIDQATVKAFSESVFAQTFAATGALSLLTLAVAGLALFASLLTLAQSRLARLAPLWTQGVERSRLIQLEAARTLMLAVFTVLFAIPLGLVLAWLLVVVINVEAFGWRLPLYAFPAQWALLGGLSVLSAALAMLWPVWLLYRQAPTQWLKTFALQEAR